ncbi:uncharacterized protein LOC142608719 [Castanea sativa]|uniref:uncharacterized protein LOC142608719 n=1 Tax=Castanea sativa TaxID=21020 RepID=UPI003F6525CA
MVDESANNPFFLLANENPGLILTSQPLTGLENYMSWTRSVFLALSAKNKFGFVNGSIPELDPYSSLFNSWSRCNTTVLSWLTNSLSMDLKASVMYINTAKDLWIDLKDKLSQGNTPRVFELQKEISHLSQGSLSVSSYFAKFKTLWDEIDNYQPFTVCTCESKSSQLDAQHKEHMLLSMYVNNSKGFHGNQGHNHGGKGGNSKKDRHVCTYCGLIGHIADKCYKLHGYPPGYKPKGGNKAMANQVAAVLPSRNSGNFGVDVFPSPVNPSFMTASTLPISVFAQCHGAQTAHQVASVMAPNPSIPQISTSNSTSPSCSSNFSGNPYWIPPNLSHFIFVAQVVDRHAYKSNTWIIDIGETDHMVHSITQFTTITSIVQTYVYLPNGEQSLVTHVGTVQVSSTLTLTSFSFNLISVSKLTKSLSCYLIFLDDCCFIQDLAQWSMIGLGKKRMDCFYCKIQILEPLHLLLMLLNIIFFEHIFPNVSSSQPSASYLDDLVFPHYTSNTTSYSSLPSIPPLVAPSSSHLPPEPSTNLLGTSSTPSAEPTTSIDSIPNISNSDPIPSTRSSPITPLPFLRRSTRPHNPPPYLSNYSCKSVSTKPVSGLPYEISNCLDYSYLGPTFHSFIMAVNTTPSKLVSNFIKYLPDGTIKRYKARLVAKGFTQNHSLDYSKTFSSVAKFVFVRIVLSLVVVKGWFLHQMDVNNSFLHGDLVEDAYMCLPPDFHRMGENMVCKLNKSLYGLKQALSHTQGSSFTVLLVYVDDILLTGNNPACVDSLKKLVNDKFGLKDLGLLRYFLGLEVTRTDEGISLNQIKYALEILDTGFISSKPVKFPNEQNLRLSKYEGKPLADPSQFRSSFTRLLEKLGLKDIFVPRQLKGNASLQVTDLIAQDLRGVLKLKKWTIAACVE